MQLHLATLCKSVSRHASDNLKSYPLGRGRLRLAHVWRSNLKPEQGLLDLVSHALRLERRARATPRAGGQLHEKGSRVPKPLGRMHVHWASDPAQTLAQLLT